MSRDHFGMAIAYTWQHDIPHAISEYKRSISVDSSLGDSANNLAWLYAVVPDAKFRDGQQAVSYARAAVAVSPNGDWLDSLACAYGAAGDFPEGVVAGKQAMQVGWAPQESNLQKDLELLSGGKACEDPSFGIDLHPFRPSHPTPAAVVARH